MKFSLSPRRPRNPFVSAARARVAGAHRSRTGALRQAARRELQREIDRIKPSP